MLNEHYLHIPLVVLYQPLTSKLFNFHPLEFVSRCRYSQLPVSERIQICPNVPVCQSVSNIVDLIHVLYLKCSI